MKKRLIAVITAAVLALAGVIVLLSWAGNADQRAYDGATLTEVVQVTSTIDVGTDAADLVASTEVVEIPSSTVPEGAVTDLGSVAGMVATTTLQPGEVLLASRMAEPDAKEADTGGVPEGMQEISISLETQQLVGGKLENGDRVGVIAGYPEKTTMLEDDVLVLGTNITDLGESAQGAAIVSLAVDENTAKKVAHAGMFGKVWLTRQNETTKRTGGVIDTDAVLR